MTRKHWFVLLPIALATSACGGGSTVPESGAVSAGGEVADRLSDRLPPTVTDLDPVPMPDSLVGAVRFGPLARTFAAVGEVMGEATLASDALERLRTLETGSTYVADLVDVSAPMVMAFVHSEEGEPDDVYAFEGPSMRSVVSALPASVTAQPRPDGSLHLPASTTEGGSNRHCSVEPTRAPERTRIVCAADPDALAASRTYLGRAALPPAELGVVRASLALEPLRARFGEQAQAGLALAATLVESALSEAESPVLRNPRVREAITVLARDVIDDVAPLVEELSSVELVLRFDSSGMTVDFDVGVRNPSGSIVRALAESLRSNAAIPQELLERLPPGAAVYMSGRFDGRPFDAFVAEVRELLVALAHAGVQLSQADADALDRALALTMRAMAYDAGVASGFDAEARPWTVTHLRYGSAAEATQAVQAYRELTSALRRPGVARAFDALLVDFGESRPRFSQIAEIRARGLPSGSYAVRTPPFEQLASAFVVQRMGLPATPPVAAAPRETFLVPSGADLLVVQGPNGRALYDSLASSGGLAAELRAALLAEGAAMTMVMRLGNVRIPDAGVRTEHGAGTLESVLGAEAGQALLTIRFRNAGTAPDAMFEFDVHAPSALLRGFIESSREAGRAAATPTSEE